jgi:RNA methyltransferase, TrmH family
MNPEIITSPVNPRIRTLLKLRKKSERKQHNMILIEGWREIRHAVAGGFRLKTIYLSQDKAGKSTLKEAYILCNEVVILMPRVFEKVAYRENVEGVLATGVPRFLHMETLTLRRNPLVIVIESAEKPGNLGAILRTAEAAAIDAVFVCDPLTDIYNPNVIRSSLGCVFKVPLITCETSEAIRFLREKKIRMFAAALSASHRYDLVDFTGPSALVLGTEATGLSDLWLQEADQSILIPMLGKHDSLNVSVSAAVLIFEALRQRRFQV